MIETYRYWLIAMSALGLFGGVTTAQAMPPVPVSPGAVDATPQIEDRCPTYTWGAGATADSYELAVYEVGGEPDDAGGAAPDPVEVTHVELPGSALAWTPPLERCLTAGRAYAWSVRARDELGDGEWPDVLFFQVAASPLTTDVEAALRIVQRYLETRGEPEVANHQDAPAEMGAKTAAGERTESAAVSVSQASLASVVAALRAEQTDPSGNTAGVVATSASPDGVGVLAGNGGGGADLQLDGQADGATDAFVTQAGLDRPSLDPEAFSFTNSGGGGMTLYVDGQEVVTTATDQDTQQELFRAVDAPSGTDPVADGPTDTLQLVAGTGMTITGDATADSVTFSVATSGLDADSVDGLDASSFLRADEADTTNGTLTLDPSSGDALITSAGRVGIGVGTPSTETELHVRTATADNFGVLVDAFGVSGSELGLHVGPAKYGSLAKNAYFDSGWQRFDTTSGAFLEEVAPDGSVFFGVADAGTNPISWLPAMQFGSDGHVGFGIAPSQQARVYGYGGSNLYGLAGLSNSPIHAGVFGSNGVANGKGVEGYAGEYSEAGAGVYGHSSSPTGSGVLGIGAAASGSTIGVFGVSNTESGYGVLGRGNSFSGTNYGVYGESYSATGYAIFGKGNFDNYAGYFDGKVGIAGTLNLESELITDGDGVGIGVASPSAKTEVHIRTDVADEFAVLAESGVSGSEIGLHLGASRFAGLAKNAYYQSGWQRFATDAGAFLQEVETDGTLSFKVAASGANPISFVEVLRLPSAGTEVEIGAQYLKLPVRSSGSAPPAADCSAASHIGRAVFDTGANRLFVCDGTSWLAH